MPDLETLSERVTTLERTVTDGEMPELQDDAELRRTTTELAARLDDLEAQQDELDAAVQALRGYVGNIRAVNADVERRADAALAKAESCRTESTGRESPSGPNRSGAEPSSGSLRPTSDDTDGNRTRRSVSAGESTLPDELPTLERRMSEKRSTSDGRSLTTRLRELL